MPSPWRTFVGLVRPEGVRRGVRLLGIGAVGSGRVDDAGRDLGGVRDAEHGLGADDALDGGVGPEEVGEALGIELVKAADGSAVEETHELAELCTLEGREVAGDVRVVRELRGA